MTADAAMYPAALVLLAASFVLYAVILRRLFSLVRRRALWLFPLAGAALLLLAAALHGFAAAVLEPVMGADPQIFRESMQLRTAAMGCLLLAGGLGALSGWAYYRSMGD